MVFSLDFQSFVSNPTSQRRTRRGAPLRSWQATPRTNNSPTRPRSGEFAALAEFVPTRLVRKAITTAVAAAQGRDVPRRVEIPISFHDSPENDGASAKLQAKHKAPRRRTRSVSPPVRDHDRPAVRHGVEVASWMFLDAEFGERERRNAEP